jgi:acylglycerol lipase
MKNTDRPIPTDNESGSFITVKDGLKIFVYTYYPITEFKITIYIISGITGINHNSEKEIIELLSNNENRVVVIHPRGTGYSEGKRGDFPNIKDFIADYAEIIKTDSYYPDSTRKLVLYGHSMSCAIAIKVADELERTDGLIFVNPPCKLKSAKGMSPRFGEYIKYICYYIFAPHVPVVNMAGDPSAIEDEADRNESEIRNCDPLLVKYFSMRCMTESKKTMDAMVQSARKADYPLLLLYGDNDQIVDKAGCGELFTEWNNENKKYEIIKGGSHGKSTVHMGGDVIRRWLMALGTRY